MMTEYFQLHRKDTNMQYTVSQKNCATFIFTVILVNISRF